MQFQSAITNAQIPSISISLPAVADGHYIAGWRLLMIEARNKAGSV